MRGGRESGSILLQPSRGSAQTTSTHLKVQRSEEEKVFKVLNNKSSSTKWMEIVIHALHVVGPLQMRAIVKVTIISENINLNI